MPASQYLAMRREARAVSAAMAPPPPPRTRTRHRLSDGESDSEDPRILYRSLRRDERPEEYGLLPPSGHDPRISARAHITAGSRARVKGPWISGTRSRKVAAAWAAEGGEGRVARFRRPPRDETESFDMTNPDEARLVFPAMRGSSFNTAKASQEVVIKDRVRRQQILEVLRAKRVSVREYEEATTETHPRMVAKIRSRTKASGRPIPVILSRMDAPVESGVAAPSSSLSAVAAPSSSSGFLGVTPTRRRRVATRRVAAATRKRSAAEMLGREGDGYEGDDESS